MKNFEVEIEGITPYMQHRMNDSDLETWEKNRGRIIERPELAKEDQLRAEYHIYRNANGEAYIPSEHIRGAMIGAGSFIKAKIGNAKKSMKNIVAGMFSITPEEIILPENWIIDKRSAVNRTVKARIISIRPKWMNWKAKFTLHVDNDTITEQTIKTIIEYAGNYNGIGSFRPTNNGMFGRFKIIEFKEIKE